MAYSRKGALAALCLLALALGAAAGAPASPVGRRLNLAASAMETAMEAFRASGDADLISLAASNGTTNNTDYITVTQSTTTGRYIAPSCFALFKLMADVNDKQGEKSRFRSITVELPCKAGSVVVRGTTWTWTTPTYDCYLPGLNSTAAVGGNLGIYYNPGPGVGGTLTVRAYTTGTNCDLRANERPMLFGGVKSPEIPLVILGMDRTGLTDAESANQARVTIQDVVIRGTRGSNLDPAGPDSRRPGISAGSLKRLTLRNVDIQGTWGTYMGAGLDLVDTPTSYSCTKAKPCAMSWSTTALPDSGWTFGAGGALSVSALAVGGTIFQSNWINFRNNVHAMAGGAWYVYKLFNKPVTVSLQNMQVLNNAAPTCSAAMTVRADGYYEEKTNKQVPGKRLTLRMPTPGTPASNTYKWQGNVANAPYTGVALCGLTLKDLTTAVTNNTATVLPMPYSTKEATRVSIKVLSNTPFALAGPLATMYKAEYAYSQN